MKKMSVAFVTWAMLVCGNVMPGASATPQPPPPAQPWKKTCDFGIRGGEGCVVTIEMRLDPARPASCPEAQDVYCVLLKVVCPPNNPPGDPGETCSEETCGLCASLGTPVSITCDGVKFEVKPKDGGQNWGTVAADCGNAEATTSKP